MKLTFDSACESVREYLNNREANALITAALELKEDSRSVADLAIEFDVPENIVEGLQS